MARCGVIWGTFAQKVSDQFFQLIFSEDNLAFLADCFEAKNSSCMRFTNCGSWEIWENVGEGGKVWGSLAKQTISAGLKVDNHPP